MPLRVGLPRHAPRLPALPWLRPMRLHLQAATRPQAAEASEREPPVRLLVPVASWIAVTALAAAGAWKLGWWLGSRSW